MNTITPVQSVPNSREHRELIPADSPLAPFIWINPGRMSGTPCFKDTRVPVQTLFDYLGAGDSLDDFLIGFPNVSRDHAVSVIHLASLGLLHGLRNL